MLSLTLKQGEYLTIGKQVVLQYDRTTGERCKLLIHAPREIPVTRGKVLERSGGPRPDCLVERERWRKGSIPWNRSKAQALAAMRRQLDQMDGRDDGVKALRRQLNHLFPPELEEDPVGPSAPGEKEALPPNRADASCDPTVSPGVYSRLK